MVIEEIGALRVATQDNAASQAQHSADIRSLAAGITVTRRALDPEALGKLVGNHIDDFLGEEIGLLAKAVKINHDAARQSAELAAKLKDATAEAETTNRGLRQIASRIKAHAERSKWDFATLAAGMTVAALLAGGGAVYFTKQQLDDANFPDAIGLIRNDDEAYWCNRAKASIVQGAGGKPFCAVQMPKYQIPEEEEEAGG